MLMVMPTRRPLLFHLYTTFCFILSYHVPHHVVAASAARPSFSFDFSNGHSYRPDDLRFEGDAVIHDGLAELTVNSSNSLGIGQMSYNCLVPFYNNTTGQVASFATQFSFAVRLVNPSRETGYDMAFFLSGYPSKLQFNATNSALGLGETLVAVKFDSYSNSWDSCRTYDHMAISTGGSWRNATCFSNFSLDGSMTASVTFNSTTRMLVASLHFYDDPSRGSLATA